MIPTTTPEELYSTALQLETKGAQGLLLSGGCDIHGRMLNLRKLLPTMKRIKRETDLVIKLHTGLLDRETAEGIVEADIDVASMEVVGDDRSISDIFGLKQGGGIGVQQYVDTFVNLSDAGMKYISPHIAVGVHFGGLLGEFNALNLLRDHIDPDTIVLIVFRPTKGTRLGDLPAPSSHDVGRVTSHARKVFPEKKILLGSLRPRTQGAGETGKERNDFVGGHMGGNARSKDHRLRDEDPRLDIELAALNNGVNAIEVPSPRLIAIMQERGYRLMRIGSFGVLPESLEKKIGYSWL